MAEFIFKDMVHKARMDDRFYIASAATSTEEIWHGIGNPVYPPARDELARHGIFCSGKRAVQVTWEDYDKYDLLICADRMNVRNLKYIVGEDREQKIHLLLEYAGKSGESVADPWYSGDFSRAYCDIWDGCKGLLELYCTNEGL